MGAVFVLSPIAVSPSVAAALNLALPDSDLLQSSDLSRPSVHSSELTSDITLSQSSDVLQQPLYSFAAVYRFTHKPSNTLLDESRVRVSRSGMRADQTIDGAENTVILNFESDRAWLVNREKHLAHEVLMDESSTISSVGSEVSHSKTPGFIQYSACAALTAQLIERKDRYGHLIEHWVCLVEDEIVGHQWFNTHYGVVVLSMTIDGYVSELINIREREYDREYFMPPPSYRLVPIEELVNGVMPISSYVESTTSR